MSLDSVRLPFIQRVKMYLHFVLINKESHMTSTTFFRDKLTKVWIRNVFSFIFFLISLMQSSFPCQLPPPQTCQFRKAHSVFVKMGAGPGLFFLIVFPYVQFLLFATIHSYYFLFHYWRTYIIMKILNYFFINYYTITLYKITLLIKILFTRMWRRVVS
jgi:hypothetical protein